MWHSPGMGRVHLKGGTWCRCRTPVGFLTCQLPFIRKAIQVLRVLESSLVHGEVTNTSQVKQEAFTGKKKTTQPKPKQNKHLCLRVLQAGLFTVTDRFFIWPA